MMRTGILIIRNRKLLFFAGILLSSLFWIASSQKVHAAYALYPNGSPSTHVTIAKAGAGINLEAPFSYLKLKYSADTYYYDIGIIDPCFHGNGGLDGGSPPAACRGGDVTFWVCPATPSGTFDSDYKNQGRCFEADAAPYGGYMFLRFWDDGVNNNPQAGQMRINTSPQNFRYLYIIAQQKVAGSNAFKVETNSRRSDFNTGSSYARVGFAATQGLDRPVSLGQMPLSGGGANTFEFPFRMPCGATGGVYNLQWFDADRGAAGIPQDYDVDWVIRNDATGQSVEAGVFAYLSSQSLDTFMGGNASKNGTPVGNGGLMRVAGNDPFTWQWRNVNNNNGVQMYLPFDEVDSDLACPVVRGRVFNIDTGQPYSNVQIHTCNSAVDDQGPKDGYVYTDANGAVNITADSFGQGFCLRITGNEPSGVRLEGAPPGVPRERIKPGWGEGYNGNCPANGTGGRFCDAYPSYECQVAGGKYNACGSSVIDRTIDVAYDFVYENTPIAAFNDKNCRQIRGWVFDRTRLDGDMYNQGAPHGDGSLNNSTGSMLLHLYVDGVMRGQFVSNLPSPDVTAAFGIPGNHRFDIDTRPFLADGNTHRFQLYALRVGTDGRPNGVNAPPIMDENIVACNLACGEVTTSTLGGKPEAGDPFDVTVSFTVSNQTFDATGRTLEITNNGGLTIAAPLSKPVTPTSIPPASSGQATFGPASVATPGIYTVTYRLNGTPGLTNCQGQVEVVTKPYIRTYSGDSKVGKEFASGGACVSNADKKFIGFNNRTTFAGAGSQLALFGTGQNVEFASAALRSTSPSRPKGLTFANTGTGAPNSEYGGGFNGALMPCIHDYYGDSIGLPTTASPGVGSPVSGVINATSSYTGGSGVIAISTSSLPTGTRRTIYVAGDAFITGNITYANAGGFADASAIPSFKLVARGNIYIAPGVTTLDGTYVAQASNANNGRIYTCAGQAYSGNAIPFVPTATQLRTDCATKLTVNGAFIASFVKFLRTNGSLRNGAPGEYFNSSAANQASEQVLMSPDMWIRPGVPTGTTDFDSIKSLPPVL